MGFWAELTSQEWQRLVGVGSPTMILPVRSDGPPVSDCSHDEGNVWFAGAAAMRAVSQSIKSFCRQSVFRSSLVFISPALFGVVKTYRRKKQSVAAQRDALCSVKA